MKKSLISCLVAASGSFLATQPAQASFDMLGCDWGSDKCYLSGMPWLSPNNDSRDNLLRLVSEEKSFALPLQPVPKNFSRSREYYFAMHNEWEAPDSTPPAPAPAAPQQDSAFAQQITALGLAADSFQFLPQFELERAERSVSNNQQSVLAFFSAILADKQLTDEQRHKLALARLDIAQNVGPDTPKAIDRLTQGFAAGSQADAFRLYLAGAAQFYLGDYELAEQFFAKLTACGQPWLEETAQYMLMRTALNKSTQNSNGEYGEFDSNKIDKPTVSAALTQANLYLQKWPEGLYADSTQGLLRRIYWYLQDWPTLAVHYETVFSQPANADSLRQQVMEYDNKLGYEYLGAPLQEAFPHAPLISFIESLRTLRTDANGQPGLTQAILDSQKLVFEQAGKLPWWNYLQQWVWLGEKNYPAIIAAIKPANDKAPATLLEFSEQVLYGDALMAQQKWPTAQQHWDKLLKLSRNTEQQQYLQARLAAAMIENKQVAAIFNAKSPITNLRYRSQILKNMAPTELLRQQATATPSKEEQTIALHTLLIRDLTEARYGDWLEDKKLIDGITPPVIDEAFKDVNLSVFAWDGKQTEPGYSCPMLEKTVAVLNARPREGHALNCMGEFFRTTRAHVDMWFDGSGTAGLASTFKDDEPGQYDRQDYYQQVITSADAEAEDKSFALYRAIMCYAPSGSNECGGQEVDKMKRKGWFTQLKTQYPGSSWAQDLKYYW